jgi:hypothetical protein
MNTEAQNMKKYPGVTGFLPPLAALLLSALLAACGGGGGGQEPILGGLGLANSLAAPTVSGVTPSSNTTVATNTKLLTASFNQSMNAGTLNSSSFLLACPTGISGGPVSYDASTNTATLPLLADLPASSACSATITSGATSANGLALATAYHWNFVTSAIADTTAPTVTSTINANGATGVPINTKVGATFSEAMDARTITASSFSVKQTVAGTPVTGTLSYAGLSAVFIPSGVLAASTQYTVTVSTAVKDLAGNPMAANYVWSWTTGATADLTPPTVTSVTPADLAVNVATASAVNATFSKAMNPLTLNTVSFTVRQGVTNLAGLVSTSPGGTIATFMPSTALASNTVYTATITAATTDLAGNPLAANKVWSFTTAAVVVPPIVSPSILASAAPFGTFGGTAGMTNTGISTVVNGDIGTIATGTSSITGFYDSQLPIPDVYTGSIGKVNGTIYTCTTSTTGPNSASVSAPNCTIATQARADAQVAYNALVAKPVLGSSPAPGANMAGITLLPGVYAAPGGSFMIQGGDLTLDAQGDTNAVWVFQMATTLTVGGPGAAFPQSVILAGGAQAKNVYWQVGSFATINAGGGGTMMGNIISQAGASFSTAGNAAIVTLNGRVLSLGASVTLVNTVITVPAP